MATSSDPRLEDIKRIAFVTGRFHALQGLRTVADAVPLLIYAALLRSTQFNLKVIITCVLAAYLVARQTWIRSRIDAYYSRRLGRVDRSPSHLNGTFLFSRSSPLGWTDRSGPDAEGFLKISAWLVLLMYQDVLANVPVSGFFLIGIILMLGLPSVQILIRDRRYRPHWFLPLGVGVAFALRLGAAATSQEVRVWQMLAWLGYGVAVALAGALDHLLLVKSLGGGAGAVSRAEHADRI